MCGFLAHPVHISQDRLRCDEILDDDFDSMFSRFDTMAACGRQTDRQTMTADTALA